MKNINVVKTALQPMLELGNLTEDDVKYVIKVLELHTESNTQQDSPLLCQYSDFMSVTEVGKEIKRCDKTVNRMLHQGILKGKIAKKGNLIRKQSVIDWLLN